MFNWFKRSTLDPLSVSMAGVKLGDRVLVLGCSDPKLIASLGAKAGLTGRTVAVDESADLARDAERVALREGALIEVAAAPLTTLPLESDSFDLVVIRDVVRQRDAAARLAILGEARRTLRPGGRCMIVDTVARTGVAALFGGTTDASSPITGDEAAAALRETGFFAVRTLAEREGLLFVEAVKKND